VVGAGTPIGTAAATACIQHHLHVAVVKSSYEDKGLQDPTVTEVEKNLTLVGKAGTAIAEGFHDITAGIFKQGDGVMDPTQFTKKKGFPFPKWEQVCDDYKVVFLGVRNPEYTRMALSILSRELFVYVVQSDTSCRRGLQRLFLSSSLISQTCLIVLSVCFLVSAGDHCSR